MPHAASHAILSAVADKVGTPRSSKFSRMKEEDRSPITQQDAEALAQGYALKSPLDGSYALLRDLAPAAVILLFFFAVGLIYFDAVPLAMTLLVLLVAVAFPILVPGTHRTKPKGYDPLHLMPLPSIDPPPGAPASKLHTVSLSTPHTYFARIRQLDLTPLIRIELNREVTMSADLRSALHSADMNHVRGVKGIIIRVLCGPRLMLRMAKYVVGSSALRKVGHLTGGQAMHLLQPNERYNFILAQRPLRMVLSHVGPGEVGGMYAKHALLAELGKVVFAGEIWRDQKGTVYINNASGTYQPAAELLPKVRDFMQQALDVPVHPRDRSDSKTIDTSDVDQPKPPQERTSSSEAKANGVSAEEKKERELLAQSKTT